MLRISVPAKHRTEQVDVLLKQLTESFQITPAKFEKRAKRVMTREASNTIEVVQPVLEVEKDDFLVSPARTHCVRDSLKGTVPLSDGEKRDLSAAGVKVEDVPGPWSKYTSYKRNFDCHISSPHWVHHRRTQ